MTDGCRSKRLEVDLLRRRFGCAVLAALGSAAHSEVPPPAAPSRPLRLPAPFEERLANGLRVVVVPRHAAPLVSARLLLLSGSETDPPRHAGRAALTAALLSRGTRRYSAPALAEAAEAIGGSIVSASGRHHSTVAITVTTPMLDAALELVGEVAMRPSFRPSELVRLRSQMLDELKLTHSSPEPLAVMAAERLLFGDAPYGRAVEGTPSSLPRIARHALISMHAAHYRADNAALVLVGDVSESAAMQLAARRFGDWPAARRTVAVAQHGAARPRRPAGNVVAIDFDAGGQAAIALGLRLPARTALGEADVAVLRVANAVLGAGYSSRLNQQIRIRRGLSYGASSSLALLPRAGLLLASVQTQDDSAAQVLELMQGEFDALIADRVGADELAARKASLIGNFARRTETTDGLAALLATQLAHGAQPASLVHYAEQISAVDAADVQRLAASHFARAQRRAAVVGDARRFAAALEPLGRGVTRLRPKDIDFD